MYKELVGLVLRSILLRIVQTWNKFWGRWTTASATAVNREADSSRSSGGPMLLQSGMLTEERTQVSQDSPSSTNLLLPPAQVPGSPGRWTRNGEFKLTCGGCSIALAGSEGEPFAEVIFRLDCTRSGSQITVRLNLHQVDFGVRNCCDRNCSARNQQCNKKCKTQFIPKVTIQVRPKPWADNFSSLRLQPFHTAQVFGLQRSSTINVQMPLISPRQASLTYQTGNTISRTAPEFGWIPACRDDESNSISWTWELYRDAKGRKLEFNKLRWGSRPLLGIRPSYMHIHPGSFLAEASWELQPNVGLQQQRLEWDVKISLHIAVLQSKRRLPGSLLTMGPKLTFDKLLEF